jgi:hypothetical protein
MKAILLMLGALSAAIIFVGCGTAVGRATGFDNSEVKPDSPAGLIAPLWPQGLIEKHFEECALAHEDQLDRDKYYFSKNASSPELISAISDCLLKVKNQWDETNGPEGFVVSQTLPTVSRFMPHVTNNLEEFIFNRLVYYDYEKAQMAQISAVEKELELIRQDQLQAEEERQQAEELERQEEERMRQAEEERREQERREEDERIAREIQAAMDDAEEREAIIEECDAQSRAEYAFTKMDRENTEQAIQTAFQECLRDAGVEGVEDEQATPEEDVWAAEVQRAQRDGVVRNITACVAEAERNGRDSHEARQDCLARASRGIGIQVNDESGVARIALRQSEQDKGVAPLVEQAEELAEEEAPIDGTAEERIAALEERVAELTELIRELTEALQPN